ncbi:hypothetical protein NQ176_g5923 [Zarea fungicola]|uniref:Uncharacterized protein n=1 Tax=Zarea fungicola TaxID=93591 RepID=A0ACC1N6H8_9HYPO|nr:hypothetical protein NQ176_g5923 [Lecanicillium fungicola]
MKFSSSLLVLAGLGSAAALAIQPTEDFVDPHKVDPHNRFWKKEAAKAQEDSFVDPHKVDPHNRFWKKEAAKAQEDSFVDPHKVDPHNRFW